MSDSPAFDLHGAEQVRSVGTAFLRLRPVLVAPAGGLVLLVTVLSGGMDSATLAYLMKAEGYAQTAISFHYGQKHARELGAATRIAERLGIPHHIVDIAGLGPILNSALTQDILAVPEGHYADASMAARRPAPPAPTGWRRSSTGSTA